MKLFGVRLMVALILGALAGTPFAGLKPGYWQVTQVSKSDTYHYQAALDICPWSSANFPGRSFFYAEKNRQRRTLVFDAKSCLYSSICSRTLKVALC
jgi:hypothetical protein